MRVSKEIGAVRGALQPSDTLQAQAAHVEAAVTRWNEVRPAPSTELTHRGPRLACPRVRV
jgi:hypothetical protein